MARVDQWNHRGTHHVRATGQNACHVIDCLGGSQIRRCGVTDAVGTQTEQLVNVVGGCDAERLDSHKLTGILTDLVWAVDPESYELELRVIRNQASGMVAYVAGTPLNDAISHGVLLMVRQASMWSSLSHVNHRSRLQRKIDSMCRKTAPDAGGVHLSD
ncbi:unannotated protein [freshwater metagenome]|uniref:Unannotated protein n=1 Tax=freshwater metagenome TaxID=449393 RepID=A0A6J6BZ10_9ZZZZ